MTYVALVPSSREARLAIAGARLEEIGRLRPELLAAATLQRRLIQTLIEAGEAVERGRLPRLSLPPKYLAAKLARGIPVLAAEPLPVPAKILRPFLLRLCRELETGGAGEPASHIWSAVDESRLDAGSLLGASLARNQDAIRVGATHMGLAADLLWLIAELAVSPFAHALQGALLPGADMGPLSDALRAWTWGFCPACGSWPALAELVRGHRVLRCSFCAAAWEPSPSCAYCTSDVETQHPQAHRPHHGLELCRGCSGYLKTVELTEFSPFPLLAITDLETMELDVAAMQSGFRRPALREFKTPGAAHR